MEAIIKTPLPSSAAGNYLTVYFRKTLNVTDPAAFTSLSIELQFDDGFVAYINGTEVTRFNMGNVGEEFAFDRTSAGSHDFSAQPTTFDLRDSLELLEAGENLIAVEVHNRGAREAVPALACPTQNALTQGVAAVIEVG